jgi:tetratricopeptide (TPR) repeat protein
LAETRRAAIGKKSAEFEKRETSVDGIVYSEPYRLDWNDKNFKALINEIALYPDVVILVASDFEKEHLRSLINTCSIDKEDLKMLKIYSIAEIKGMEYEYVVCFNMINAFKPILQKFFSENGIRKDKETKNRLCFNSIYVAITRSQKYLCFVDEQPLEHLDKVLKLDQKRIFDAEELYFSNLSKNAEAWLKNAKKLKEAQKYEDALKYFIRSGVAQQSDIYECEAELALLNKEYDRALIYFLACDKRNSVEKYINDKAVSKEFRQFYSIVNKVNVQQNSVAVIQNIVSKVKDEDVKYKLYSIAIDGMSGFLQKKIKLTNI